MDVSRGQDKRRLLAVFAHPDDESFGPGGTLARYAHEGAEVWLVCATDGNAGTVDAAMLEGYKSTSQLRAAELCCAAQTLGLAGVDWLGYRDSGMAGAPENQHPDSLVQARDEQVVEKLVASIRRHRPQVILCDNQYGGYGHPDHLKLHGTTMTAFRMAADPAYCPELGAPHQASYVYHPAFTVGLMRVAVRIMPALGMNPRRFGRNHDIDLLEVVQWETPVHVRIDTSRYADIKAAASECHRSQEGPGGIYRRFPGWLRRRLLGTEMFTQAIPTPRPRGRRGDDLFRGAEA